MGWVNFGEAISFGLVAETSTAGRATTSPVAWELFWVGGASVSAAWVLIAPAINNGAKASFLRVGCSAVESEEWEFDEIEEGEFIGNITVTETLSHKCKVLINTRSQFQ